MDGLTYEERVAYTRRLIDALYRITQSTVNLEAQLVRRHNVTVEQGHTLLFIPPKGQITTAALSEKLRLSSSTITTIIDQLVFKNLAKRTASPDDHSAVQVKLTKAGAKTQLVLRNDFDGFFYMILSNTPPDYYEHTLNVLDRVADALVFVFLLKATVEASDEEFETIYKPMMQAMEQSSIFGANTEGE